MSLLMEALRKAEEAKRRVQEQEEARAAGGYSNGADASSDFAYRNSQSAFALEEREPDVTPAWIFDNFVHTAESTEASADSEAESDASQDEPAVSQTAASTDLDSYFATRPQPDDEDAMLAPASSARALAGAAARRQQQAAASVFTAKQKPAGNRRTLHVLAVTLVLLVSVGGAGAWYLSRPSTSVGINPAIAGYDLSTRGYLDDPGAPLAAAPDTAATDPGANPAPSNAAATVAVDADLPALDAGEPAITTVVAETSTAATPSAAVPATIAPLLPLPVPVPGTAAAAPVATAALALPAPRSVATLQVTRSASSRQSNPQLNSAYASLQQGNAMQAGELYQQVLAEFPNNRDALLGLAMAQFRQGDAAAARALYARQLQLNPRDPLARTGLLQTMQAIDPLEHEHELKTLLSQFPDVAPLAYALGNLYAGQQRWSEAQDAYFTALLNASRAEGPVHPDYAFNLAVSLEQLRQPQAALTYYRQARELAQTTTPGFAPDVLVSRLAFLEQDQP